MVVAIGLSVSNFVYEPQPCCGDRRDAPDLNRSVRNVRLDTNPVYDIAVILTFLMDAHEDRQDGAVTVLDRRLDLLYQCGRFPALAAADHKAIRGIRHASSVGVRRPPLSGTA